jgi:hypothetical protein
LGRHVWPENIIVAGLKLQKKKQLGHVKTKIVIKCTKLRLNNSRITKEKNFCLLKKCAL